MAKKLPRGLTLDQGRYRIRIASRSRPGRVYHERLPEGTTRRQAETYRARVREQDRLGVLLWPDERETASAPRPETTTIRNYARDTYLPYCRARNAASTVQRKIQCLQMCDPWFGDVAIDQVTPQLVYEYQAERKAEGVRSRTINMEWGTILHLLRHAHKAGDLPHSPPAIDRLPEKDSRETRALTIEECERALHHARTNPYYNNDLWFALVMTMLHTGARWSDVRGLRWSDVDLDGRVVKYRAEEAKQSRAREVPLSTLLVDALAQLSQDHELVFARISHQTSEWIPLGTKAPRPSGRYIWDDGQGGLDVGPHAFRHTFATLKLRAGVSIALVSRWLGHASIQLTVDTYGHIEPGDHHEEMMRGPQVGAPSLRVVG